MNNLNEAIKVFGQLTDIREKLKPLKDECDRLYKEFNDKVNQSTMPSAEESFISQKLYDNLSDEQKEELLKDYMPVMVVDSSISSSDGKIYTTTMHSSTRPFNPLNDKWRIYDIETKIENGMAWYKFIVSSVKDEASVSGIMTIYEKTYSTDWISAEEIDNIDE